MNLAVISHKLFYFDGERYLTTGGFGRDIEALSPYFDRITLCVTVLEDPNRHSGFEIRCDNVTFYPLPSYEHYRSGWPRRLALLKVLPRSVWLIAKNVSNWDILYPRLPSYIGIWGLIFAKVLRKPCFVWFGGDWAEYWVARKDTLLRRWGGRFIDAVHKQLVRDTVTFVTADSLYEKFKRVTDHVYLMRTATLSEDQIVSESSAMQGEKIRILFVGQLEPVKGVKYLLEGLSILLRDGHQACLTIVGEGDHRSEMERQIADLQLQEHVSLRGYVPWGDKLFNVYREADVFVLPSLMEGIPKVMVEAMASGVPVIATRVGGVESVVSHNVNGKLIEPRSPDAIVEAILDLRGNPKLRQAIIEQGFETARNTTLERETACRMQIVDEVLPGYVRFPG